MPLSSSCVWAIAPARLACELLSWAISSFWSAIFRWSARCCAWASVELVAADRARACGGRGEHADEEGDRQEGDEEAGPAVSARPRKLLGCRVAGQRAGVLISCERFVSGRCGQGYGARNRYTPAGSGTASEGTPETTGSRLPGSVPAWATRSRAWPVASRSGRRRPALPRCDVVPSLTRARRRAWACPRWRTLRADHGPSPLPVPARVPRGDVRPASGVPEGPPERLKRPATVSGRRRSPRARR